MVKAVVELDKWERQLRAQLKKASDDNFKVWKRAYKFFLERVKQRTPVGNPSLWRYPAKKGYNPGTLKRSWMLEQRRKTATVSNTQPYAVRVEFGWSSQAPRGMMRLTTKELPELIKKAMRGIDNG